MSFGTPLNEKMSKSVRKGAINKAGTTQRCSRPISTLFDNSLFQSPPHLYHHIVLPHYQVFCNSSCSFKTNALGRNDNIKKSMFRVCEKYSALPHTLRVPHYLFAGSPVCPDILLSPYRPPSFTYLGLTIVRSFLGFPPRVL